ncbi:MAG: 30S ribosomal protein S6 [Minisyncoccia bacterium]
MNINNTQTSSQESAYALEPRVYELGYHILPTVNEGDLNDEREALVAIITKFNGMVVSEETPALIDLAYDMDKVINNKRNIFSQAYFGWIKFDLAPESIVVLTAEIDALPSLLRFLVIKTVRENTIVSEKPYRLARTNTSDDVSEDDMEMPVAETAAEIEAKEAQTSTGSNDEVVETHDLTKIEGIGPKIAEIFVAAGIKTFADLSESKVGDLRTILEENKLSSHDPKTWSKQATLAKNGKWDKLAELQEELNGGKEA